MKWVVQDNLYDEYGYVRFIEALDRLGCDYVIVKPVPFTNVLLPSDFDVRGYIGDINDAPQLEIDDSGGVIVFGATTLSRVSISKGWYPGTFLNDNFDYSRWRDGFGVENLLNGDAIVAPVHSLHNINSLSDVFIRPVHDSKAISGTVMSSVEFEEWRKVISEIEEEEFVPLHKNTMMVLSSVKKIYAEYRIFIVGGEVVTASRYKLGDQVVTSSVVDDCVISFAEDMVNKWHPAEAFVIDVADTPEGFKVIEINNINSAGFYEADPFKIIEALLLMMFNQL